MNHWLNPWNQFIETYIHRILIRQRGYAFQRHYKKSSWSSLTARYVAVHRSQANGSGLQLCWFSSPISGFDGTSNHHCRLAIIRSQTTEKKASTSSLHSLQGLLAVNSVPFGNQVSKIIDNIIRLNPGIPNNKTQNWNPKSEDDFVCTRQVVIPSW